ncbi:MAG: glycoside hydrolase family 127 protein, partial [Anaerolineae bacterium]|nr:glycoside hydrolase family 127 protein [Anaerolineae bacterium]
MIKAQPFNLKQVRLLDGIFKDNMQRDQNYLLHLEPDRFLHSFRVTAGLPSEAQPYGGWEAPEGELRGHSLGHYLSACALMFASTGDEQFKARADTIVAELAKCQDALPAQGYNMGFLSAYPEEFFERVERRFSVWAPYYTLHKILAGLFDAYQYCDNQQALDVLEKVASWLQFRIDRLTYEQMQITLLNEFGGMNEVLANLYGVTGKAEHLKLSLAFDDAVILDPLARQQDSLDRLHANTQIPKAIGVARQYEVTGEDRFREIAHFFWERVALYRSYAIGGNSDDELFFPITGFAQHLSSVSAETCNTYNMLKLSRHLFGWEPSAQIMDFYERGLFNHILGSQDPESGMTLYFASMKPGHFKAYNTPFNSFWCCTGSGMENHAKYGDTIYFHDDDSLFVNLFIASELTWPEKGLTLRQETAFPEEDKTHFSLHCEQPVQLALKIRYPAWAQG